MKHSLERTLSVVKEIKSRYGYYIGTKEAYELVKRLRGVVENPVIIAEEINQRVSELSEISYLATPERIVGMNDVFSDVEDDMTYFGDVHNANKIIALGSYSGFYDIICNPIGGFWEDDEEIIKEFIDGYFPFFLSGNQQEILDDNDFGEVIKKTLEIRAEKWWQGIPNDPKYAPLSANLFSILMSLENVDWPEILSKKRLAKREAEILSRFSDSIEFSRFIERIKKDRVDHRFEYRRIAVTSYLVTSKPKSYEESMTTLKESLERSKERLDDLEKLDPPQVVLDGMTRIVQSKEFLINVLAADKNFVNRYLSHE